MDRQRKNFLRKLHSPAQSLIDRARNTFDTIIEESLIVFIAWSLALFEWMRYFFLKKMIPVPLTLVAIIVTCVYIIRLRRLSKENSSVEKGIEGEKIVGRHLEEELTPLGYYIIHDIVADNFNIDHVVIGPTGIFCIETKNWTKPTDGEHHAITSDGKRIFRDGFPVEKDVIFQATSSAKWLSRLLKQLTGRGFYVQPAVVFLNWFTITPKKPGYDLVWILNETGIIDYIKKNFKKLSLDDTALIVAQIKNHIVQK
ncbi:MAG: hypothetical protein A2270_01115 [Elusimicrobia bacterium RIFOXYA12_FULL_51_18]|nr:MAG: hypothetical protein A2270_01115 [Elusimicrobia bacterium RIFOXYA12_FULL_51_18]OGS31097.1 MAG: hypothetical protein A2218_02020 [Elusimicrobia bacterium RIFOXYA2_FULL_53_38]